MQIKKIQEKILSLDLLKSKLRTIKQTNQKIVFTNGCFDIVHKGHIHTLVESKQLGDVLIVGLNSDRSVKGLKGTNRPIQGEDQRALILASFLFVDFVVLFEDETPIKLIKTIVPDVLVKGGDYSLDEIVGNKVVLENGGCVKMIPYLEGFSTTKTINKIAKN